MDFKNVYSLIKTHFLPKIMVSQMDNQTYIRIILALRNWQPTNESKFMLLLIMTLMILRSAPFGARWNILIFLLATCLPNEKEKTQKKSIMLFCLFSIWGRHLFCRCDCLKVFTTTCRSFFPSSFYLVLFSFHHRSLSLHLNNVGHCRSIVIDSWWSIS